MQHIILKLYLTEIYIKALKRGTPVDCFNAKRMSFGYFLLNRPSSMIRLFGKINS